MLTARGLRKRYKSREVVHDFGLDLGPGEVVGLLGPNGAGKTTCFYMIVGLVPTDAGRIELDGEDISGLPMHERARRGIGYLPQEASVFRSLSVSDNLMAVLELRSDLNAERRTATLESLLDEFSGGDASVKDRMQQALLADIVLQRRWALDASLLEFVQRARNVGHNAGATHGRA